MSYKNIVVLCMSLLISETLHSYSMVSQAYAYILGNQDLKQEYRAMVDQALTDFGVKYPEQVLVKKMNIIGSCIAGLPLSSFTACGIWFNQEYLDSCTSDQIRFQVYHEVAHYVKNHHPQLVATVVGWFIASLAGLKAVSKDNKLFAIGYGVCAVLLSGKLLVHIVKNQEKEADVVAACKLRSIGQGNVVQAHVHALQESSDQGLWWCSADEQVEYLKD